MAIEIVDFPMKNGGSFHCYVNVHQRVITSNFLETSHSNSLFGRVYVSWAVGGRLSQKPKPWRFFKHLLIAVAGFGRCVFTIVQR